MRIFFILRISWNNISGQQQIIFFSCTESRRWQLRSPCVTCSRLSCFMSLSLRQVTMYLFCNPEWATESEQHAWFVVFLEQHYCNVSVAGGKSIEQWLKYVLIYWPNCAGSNIEHWLKYVLIDWSNCGGSNIEQCQPWGNLEPLPWPDHWPELNTSCPLPSESIVNG